MMCRAKLSIFWITALSETGFSRRHRVIVSVHQETKDNGRSVSQAVAGFRTLRIGSNTWQPVWRRC